MKLIRVSAKNFRTLEDFSADLDPHYTAISGINNSGKSNLVDAIRLLIDTEDYEYYPPIYLNFESDFPTWRRAKKGEDIEDRIEVTGIFRLEQASDIGLIQFLKQFLKIEESNLSDIQLSVSIGQKEEIETSVVTIHGETYPPDLSEEVRKRLRDGKSLVFHNSTTDTSRTRYYGIGQFTELSRTANEIIDQYRSEIGRKLKKALAPQQQMLQSLISRMSDRVVVSIEPPNSFAHMPYSITLSDSGASVPLKSWGSGTQNKTMILLALIRASQASQSPTSTDRLTPILMIEEPESFLHPSAQGEFGTALIKLSEELNVQVIVSTHSVALLNTDRPKANLLFDRVKKYNKPYATSKVMVDDSNWMAPFASLLGFSSKSFEPWQEALTLRGKRIVLVEGVIDQSYLENMKSEDHGKDRLQDDICVLPYNGVDNICNESILKLVIELSSKCVVTCDVDMAVKAVRTFEMLGLQEGVGYLLVGKASKSGNVEDLIPDRFKTEVYADNPDLVTRLMGPSKDARSAKSAMKLKIADYFLKNANPGDDYKELRALAKRINKALE